jgi:hypothetical protein
MSYRIAGIDVHKKMLAVVMADVDVRASTSLTGERSAPAPINCEPSPDGCSSARSRKS